MNENATEENKIDLKNRGREIDDRKNNCGRKTDVPKKRFIPKGNRGTLIRAPAGSVGITKNAAAPQLWKPKLLQFGIFTLASLASKSFVTSMIPWESLGIPQESLGIPIRTCQCFKDFSHIRGPPSLVSPFLESIGFLTSRDSL